MNKNQTNNTFFVDENLYLFDNLYSWKSELFFLSKAFCDIATICGEGMIVYYISRHAPKERQINKLVLIDQVCETHKEF